MKIIVSAATAIAIALTPAAFAAPPAHKSAKEHSTLGDQIKKMSKERFANGEVKSYSSDTRLLQLASGGDFTLAPGVTAPTLKTGQKVSVRWTEKDGKRIADQVTAK